MPYKKSHSGSTSNIPSSHQDQLENQSTVGKLSTFTGGSLGGSGKNSLVQMRRPTNKKGKQAPAPPKRTRYVLQKSMVIPERPEIPEDTAYGVEL